ncbi:MAG: LamG domain-containing protein, partial [Pedobacter sp.]
MIYVLYGDPSINSFQGNATAAWNNNYVTVHHLKDGTTLTPTDATANGNNGTSNGATATAGKINGAANFNGAPQYIGIGTSEAIGVTGNMTIEAWVNPSDYANYNGIISKTTGGYPKPFDFYLNQSNGVPQLVRGSGTVWGYSAVGASAAPATNTWSHVVVTINGGTVTHYLNGVANGSGALSGDKCCKEILVGVLTHLSLTNISNILRMGSQYCFGSIG